MYDTEISEMLANKLPCDSNAIKEAHRELKAKVVEFFRKAMIGHESDYENYHSRILDKIKSLRTEVEENNLDAFKENCEEVMSGIIQEIEESIDSGKIDSIEKLSKEFGVIEHK
mmetsp:Transcript_62403/g.135239  ORF Transcript_62403/g.135239 Transcript_62403/m.135239 type:complete len:114 (+) Transcript_62403:356-697(+)